MYNEESIRQLLLAVKDLQEKANDVIGSAEASNDEQRCSTGITSYDETIQSKDALIQQLKNDRNNIKKERDALSAEIDELLSSHRAIIKSNKEINDRLKAIEAENLRLRKEMAQLKSTTEDDYPPGSSQLTTQLEDTIDIGDRPPRKRTQLFDSYLNSSPSTNRIRRQPSVELIFEDDEKSSEKSFNDSMEHLSKSQSKNQQPLEARINEVQSSQFDENETTMDDVVTIEEMVSTSSSSSSSSSQKEKLTVLDFTTHPKRKSNWWPEDFKPNPLVNFGMKEAFKMRKIRSDLVHPAIASHNEYQRKYLQDEISKDFNRLAGPVNKENNKWLDIKTPDPKQRKTSTIYLPSPQTTPSQQLSNTKIDPIFKYELHKDNITVSGGGGLKSKKVKLWLDLQDSPPGHERSEFPTDSQLERDNKLGLYRARVVGLRRLFQSIFMIDVKDHSTLSFEQCGKFIFKDESFNKAVLQGRFKVDESIFYDSGAV
ncbi:hypothetical protein CANARDRAFT_7792 [[Candida] arabinofermentans NRRL YB-2248]|uniref:Uncharacterized protein n=1 Tax=[Candida] arabinofermentans NRRL YB-2248 TaxID=983967 RepID=A0A1E4T0A6_9ASCO|nr:hypothetical protein CANARDRAFT_7792 [[Candida] arabinofermentans NRRL YB-2248]